MIITIDTNGRGDDTEITINGKAQVDLVFFEFSVNVDKSNKATLFTMRHKDGKYNPSRLFGDDIKRYDELTAKNVEVTNVIGESKRKK